VPPPLPLSILLGDADQWLTIEAVPGVVTKASLAGQTPHL